MFPDTTSEWEGYPSIIDGIRYPYVHIAGGSPGYINLLVTGEGTDAGAYGISVRPVLNWVVDDFEYSVTGHGRPSLAYDGRTYTKRARQSGLLRSYRGKSLQPIFPDVRHLAFIGGDDCSEVLTQSDFSVEALASKAESDQWVEQVRAASTSSGPVRRQFASGSSRTGPTRSTTNASCCDEVECIVRTKRQPPKKLGIDFAITCRLRVRHERRGRERISQ